MESPIGISRQVGLNTVPDVHRYSHSTPVADLHPTSTNLSANEYNEFNLQNINTPTSPKWKNNENILEENSREVACAYLMALWHTLPMIRSKPTCF